MALPAFFYSADRLIRNAMRDAGRLQFGADPTPEQYADAMDRLNDIIISFQVDGLKLWLNTINTPTLVAGTASYNITSPRALRVLEAWYVATDGTRTPLTPYAQSEYYNLGNITTAGRPIAFEAFKYASGVTVRLWPVPDASAVASGAVHCLIQTAATNPEDLDEAIAFPPEWFIALRWALADELASGQHELIVSRCERKAREFKEKLEAWDVEDASTFFTMNMQGR